MFIHLKNEKDFIKSDSFINAGDVKSIKVDSKIADPSPQDFIDYINDEKNNLLPSDIKENTSVVFINFSMLSDIGNLSLRKRDTEYNAKNNKVLINKSLYEKDGVYSALKEKGFSKKEITNLVIAHEIGHFIHRETSNKNNIYINSKNDGALFINKLMTFSERIFAETDPHGYVVPEVYKLRQATREGYPDLYSAILLNKFYPEEKANSMIKALHDYRYNQNHWSQYYTSNALETYIKEKDSLTLNSFNDISEYIHSNISKNAIKVIVEQKEVSDYFLGIMDGLSNSRIKTSQDRQKEVDEVFPFLKGLKIKNNDINTDHFYSGKEAIESFVQYQRNKNGSTFKSRLKMLLNKSKEKPDNENKKSGLKLK